MTVGLRCCSIIMFCLVLNTPVTTYAGATKEKCTCDLATANDSKGGADVANASACYLTKDTNREWCTFDVDRLSSSEKTDVQQFVDSSSSNQRDLLVTFFSKRIELWATMSDLSERLEPFELNVDDIVNTVSDALARDVDLLESCIVAMGQEEENRSEELRKGDSIQCGVHPNGWLTLAFDFSNFVLYYILGPIGWRS